MKYMEEYFLKTGFYDLFPTALQVANELGYDENEIIEAVCKVSDKFCHFPPTKNRSAWFRMVFTEKLSEARADILYYKTMR